MSEPLCEKCGVKPVRSKVDPRGKRPRRCEGCSPPAEYMRKKTQIRQARWTEKEWAEQRARWDARAAQDDGLITVQPCALCRGTVGLEKHHHDYKQPLNVTWLCQPCHIAIDQLEGIRPASKSRWDAIHRWCPPRDMVQGILFEDA